MGDCTEFGMEIYDENGKKIREELKKELENNLRKETGEMNLFFDGVKWYSRQGDMKSFSKKHPQYLFVLTGIGEGVEIEEDTLEGVFREYWKNGKRQFSPGKIVFEDFNAEKLR